MSCKYFVSHVALLFILGLLIFSTLPFDVISGQEEPVEILLSAPETIGLGNTFDLLLTLDPGGREIGGWTCEVVFSADMCQARTVTPDPLWSEFFDNASIDNGQGRITAIQTWKTEAYPTTSHILCSITFRAISSGVCTFSLEDVIVTDALFSPVNVTLRTTTITVTGEASSDPAGGGDSDNESGETTDDVTGDGDEGETNPDSPVDNVTDQQEPDDRSENSEEGEEEDPLEERDNAPYEQYGAEVSTDSLQDTVLPLVIIAVVCIAMIFLILWRRRG